MSDPPQTDRPDPFGWPLGLPAGIPEEPSQPQEEPALRRRRYVPTQQTGPTVVDTTKTTVRACVLVLDAVGLIIALVWIALSLHSQLDAANQLTPPPSAIQIVQVYTQSLYQIVIAIGFGIGVYFFARVFDD